MRRYWELFQDTLFKILSFWEGSFAIYCTSWRNVFKMFCEETQNCLLKILSFLEKFLRILLYRYLNEETSFSKCLVKTFWGNLASSEMCSAMTLLLITLCRITVILIACTYNNNTLKLLSYFQFDAFKHRSQSRGLDFIIVSYILLLITIN